MSKPTNTDGLEVLAAGSSSAVAQDLARPSGTASIFGCTSTLQDFHQLQTLSQSNIQNSHRQHYQATAVVWTPSSNSPPLQAHPSSPSPPNAQTDNNFRNHRPCHTSLTYIMIHSYHTPVAIQMSKAKLRSSIV